jgi:RecA/RadA recombinase
MAERIRVSNEVEELQDDIMRRECGLEDRIDFVNSGCDMLNLPLSGKINGGWARGRIVNLVGDGSSGKTLLALEFAAYSYYNWSKYDSPIFGANKNVKIVYDNREGVMDFPVEHMYGEKFYNSIDWQQSSTVEAMAARFFSEMRALKPKESLIYIIDSWDALDSEDDVKKFEEDMAKRIKGTKIESGSYDLGKQRFASKTFFKRLCDEMADKDVTLVIVSQTRVKIGVTFGKKKYRAGGDALNFFTHQVVWLYEKEKLSKQVLGHQRVYGIVVRAKVERSKVWKPYRETEFTIIFDYGVDNITSMINWYFGPKKVEFTIWGEKYKRQDFIDALAADSDILEAFKIEVQSHWDKIETTLMERSMSRPKKFSDER